MTNLLEHIGQSIRMRKLLPRGQSVLVAVSGGMDSMVLLHLLHALATKNRWKLFVAHFNHQLRGRSSNADERLVRKTAVALKLPFVVERAAVRRYAKKQGVSLEMAARKLRHEFLAQTARRRNIPIVALAHHAGDQVELFFLRLLRGTGGEGIAGMKWLAPSPADAGIRLARPLLDVSKAELEAFARKNKIRFREDASNAARDILRNRIRHVLLPLLRRRFQPAIEKTVLRLMEIVGDEAEIVTNTARAWISAKRREPFNKLSPAVQRRVIQLQLLERSVATDFEMVEFLRSHANRLVTISPLVSVSRDIAGFVQVRTHQPASFNSTLLAIELRGRTPEAVFDGVQFRWQFDERCGVHGKGRFGQSECFDADKIGSRVVLRHWRAGDRFQPIGMRTAVKLQDWFTNQKIPRAQRHELVVATTANEEIFWIENQRISERFKLTSKTKHRLIWRWKRHKSCIAGG